MKKGFIVRLEKEYVELKERTNKLKNFLENIDNAQLMTKDEWNILCCQRDAMVTYLSILELRLINLDVLLIED